jgi:hypothetical protein
MVFNYYSATPLAFPHWQRKYEALVSEIDENRITQCATALETAIFCRLQELPKNPSSSIERAAIRAAVVTLRTIQVEKLGFPRWNIAAGRQAATLDDWLRWLTNGGEELQQRRIG